MKTRYFLLAFILGLSLTAFAQTKGDEIRPLGPGQPVEREISADESHIYEISLKAGQFVRFHLDQQTIKSALILTAPDGKQMAEMNPRSAYEQKTFWLEAAATGSYRLTGNLDLTAHVDFQALVRAVEAMGVASFGALDQSQFLRRLGIEQRAASLKTEAANSADIDQALARLIGHDRTAMGELFKVVAFAHPSIGAPPGFEAV